MTPKPDPQRSTGFLITDVSHLLRRSFNRRVQDLGLTQAQWRAIAHLSRCEGMNQAALAEHLEVQPITLARLVDRMEAAGWVERRTDPGDRRAVRLYLTEKCQPILAEMHDRAAKMLEEAFVGVTATAQRHLLEALCKIKQNLSSAEAAASNGALGRTGKDGARQDESNHVGKRRQVERRAR
ncbi:MAG TPA: MarR family transcriptional regulator [Gammaproteobacteria bacterium]|nr:MarR family transcriptional regulator [Gammaproteobacteria bacterium]